MKLLHAQINTLGQSVHKVKIVCALHHKVALLTRRCSEQEVIVTKEFLERF